MKGSQQNTKKMRLVAAVDFDLEDYIAVAERQKKIPRDVRGICEGRQKCHLA